MPDCTARRPDYHLQNLGLGGSLILDRTARPDRAARPDCAARPDRPGHLMSAVRTGQTARYRLMIRPDNKLQGWMPDGFHEDKSIAVGCYARSMALALEYSLKEYFGKHYCSPNHYHLYIQPSPSLSKGAGF